MLLAYELKRYAFRYAATPNIYTNLNTNFKPLL